MESIIERINSNEFPDMRNLLLYIQISFNKFNIICNTCEDYPYYILLSTRYNFTNTKNTMQRTCNGVLLKIDDLLKISLVYTPMSKLYQISSTSELVKETFTKSYNIYKVQDGTIFNIVYDKDTKSWILFTRAYLGISIYNVPHPFNDEDIEFILDEISNYNTSNTYTCIYSCDRVHASYKGKKSLCKIRVNGNMIIQPENISIEEIIHKSKEINLCGYILKSTDPKHYRDIFYAYPLYVLVQDIFYSNNMCTDIDSFIESYYKTSKHKSLMKIHFPKYESIFDKVDRDTEAIYKSVVQYYDNLDSGNKATTDYPEIIIKVDEKYNHSCDDKDLRDKIIHKILF